MGAITAIVWGPILTTVLQHRFTRTSTSHAGFVVTHNPKINLGRQSSASLTSLSATDADNVEVESDDFLDDVHQAVTAVGLPYSRDCLEEMSESELEEVMQLVVDKRNGVSAPTKPSVDVLTRKQMLELLLLYKKRLPDYVRNSPTKMKWLSETAEKQELRELVEDCLFSIKHVDDTTRRKITDQKGALQEDRVLPSNQEEEDLSSGWSPE
eukprot:GHVN01073185.1.p1 GENE.GHVN01073185.1~~GHVN01073185.1.p1  ORF type:complete len:211 (+),score=36.92 GHVN01073185.1:839-1471(+)